MRILHTSDWHLGMSLGNIPLLEDQRHFTNQLLKILKEERIELLLLAGDIYDTTVAKSDAIRLYDETIKAICADLAIPVIAIAGNHDGAPRLAAHRDLLKETGYHVTGRLHPDLRPARFGNIHVHSLPYFTIDEARALHPQEKIQTYHQAMSLVLDGIRNNLDPNAYNILLAHAFVRGGQTSESDKTAAIGTTDLVGADLFHTFDYVALGHLHAPQNVGPTLRYSGTPLKYSASEAEQTKTFTLLDTDTRTLTEIPTHPLRDLRVLRGPYQNILEAGYSEDYIKADITDHTLGLQEIQTLRELFPNLFTLKFPDLELDGAQISLTIEEIKNLSPEKIMLKFFEENFDFQPDEEQIRLFREALAEAWKGGDLS